MKALRLTVILVLFLLTGCRTAAQPALGSAENPIKMGIVPFIETQQMVQNMQPFLALLEKETGYKYTFDAPTSYAVLIEGMGADRVDVGWYGPLAYVLANQKYGAQVIAVSVNSQNATSYRSEILVRADSPIKTVADLKGKKFAWVDPASASGYLYPRALIAQVGDPDTFFSQQIFAGGHDKAVIALYNEQVDGAATYEGARQTVEKTLPDVMQKTRVIATSANIPNDNVAVRKGLPPEVVQRLRDGLLKVTSTEDGKIALKKAIGTNGLAPAKDSDYDPVRQAAKVLKLDLESQVKGK